MPREPGSIPRMRPIGSATTSRAPSAPSSSIGPTASCELLNTVRSGGAGPTYVSVHPGGRHLLVANYFGGSVAVLPILADGRLGDASDVKVDAGTIGPRAATHAPPGSFAVSGHDRTHAHMIQADPSGRFVLHADLGLDRIFIWKFDDQQRRAGPERSALGLACRQETDRGISISTPMGRWFYSIQEEGSTIVLFDYDARSGRLDAAADDLDAAARIRRQQLLLGDPGLRRRALRVRRQPAARQHRASSRSAPTADLTYAGEEWTRGDYPRSFNFDPTGQLPLLLQPARRRDRRLPRRPRDRRPRPSRATTPPSAIRRASSSSTSRRHPIRAARSRRVLDQVSGHSLSSGGFQGRSDGATRRVHVSPAARPRWWRRRSSSSASSPRRHALPHRHQPQAPRLARAG